MQLSLNDTIRYIKGVGPSREKLFNRLNIFTVSDLIFHFPRDYEDRTRKKKIMELCDGEKVSFSATVKGSVSMTRTYRNLLMVKASVIDETGSASLTWFNSTYVKQALKSGKTYTFYGQVKRNVSSIDIINPIFEEAGKCVNTGKILPIYPTTLGLPQNAIRNAIKNTLDIFRNKFDEFLPESIRLKCKLDDINNALYYIHFPDTSESFESAKRRLVFEELLILELGLMRLKSVSENDKNGIKFKKSNEIEDFIKKLPFSLTNAQVNVLKSIFSDMGTKKPMRRLLQGDVGSGKTIVAAISIFNAVKNGYQAVMMAPTGILAEQHYSLFKELFEREGIRVELVSGGLTAKEKRIVKDKIKTGDAQIIIGTHALLEEDVIFKNLGFVVTDEQHRFGVNQRNVLNNKGKNPDTLIMTATPIPRTLALILYGDLDISIIDELPPGRKPIETFSIGPTLEERLNSFIRKETDNGQQVYVVCPLIEESEESDDDRPKLKTVIEIADSYKKIFPDLKVEFLHGRMKQSEKNEIMQRFKNNEISILVSTTVIEVGVNVPNATLMIIENAERFGLAALHQLRGRVGRGSDKSYCILKCYGFSETVKERMNIMVKTNDGFKIAEKDLELRGPGEFLGIKQHGVPEFKIANIFADRNILEESSKEAKDIMLNYSENSEYQPLFNKVNEKFNNITL